MTSVVLLVLRDTGQLLHREEFVKGHTIMRLEYVTLKILNMLLKKKNMVTNMIGRNAVWGFAPAIVMFQDLSECCRRMKRVLN